MLFKSIESVKNQSYQNWELLIIDDVSTDNTMDVINNQMRLDSRIKFIQVEKSKVPGISYYLNEGVRNSKGKYIGRIDDDDTWSHKDKLKKQVNFLEDNPEYVIVGCGVILIDSEGKELGRYYKRETDEQIRNKALYANPMTHPTIVFRKDAFDKIGGYRFLKHAEDWDLVLRLGKIGKLHTLQEYLITYTLADHNISLRNQRELGKTLLELIKEYRYDYPKYNVARLICFLQYSYSFLPLGLRRILSTNLMYIKRKYF